jgi:hypothetical protein
MGREINGGGLLSTSFLPSTLFLKPSPWVAITVFMMRIAKFVEQLGGTGGGWYTRGMRSTTPCVVNSVNVNPFSCFSNTLGSVIDKGKVDSLRYREPSYETREFERNSEIHRERQ